jgi:hypothetical protein
MRLSEAGVAVIGLDQPRYRGLHPSAAAAPPPRLCLDSKLLGVEASLTHISPSDRPAKKIVRQLNPPRGELTRAEKATEGVPAAPRVSHFTVVPGCCRTDEQL